ncbi:MAG: Zn-ribbon domain-containing OB-fold protein [Candidatus Binatia bacterium]|nr:Zn-ribbon domain-containing OB-fold protein [Candidatus Binatia bacterium]MDG2009399.1 Zn-ribbon domain-containing OB-fold protein [Candidatus Binatia bacterium]
MSERPLPRVDEESRGYWEAARRHQLLLQRCRACGAYRHHPRAVCPNCLSSEVEWVVSVGRGEIYTFTVTYQNQSPGFAGRVPYVLAYVLLEEGIQILTNIVDADPAEIRIGQAVRVCFEDLAEEISIPVFRLL